MKHSNKSRACDNTVSREICRKWTRLPCKMATKWENSVDEEMLKCARFLYFYANETDRYKVSRLLDRAQCFTLQLKDPPLFTLTGRTIPRGIWEEYIYEAEEFVLYEQFPLQMQVVLMTVSHLFRNARLIDLAFKCTPATHVQQFARFVSLRPVVECLLSADKYQPLMKYFVNIGTTELATLTQDDLMAFVKDERELMEEFIEILIARQLLSPE